MGQLLYCKICIAVKDFICSANTVVLMTKHTIGYQTAPKLASHYNSVIIIIIGETYVKI